MTPSTPPHFQLTRDERLQILTLRSLNMKYEDIAKHSGVSIRQVQLACKAGHPTPSERSGRPLAMKDEEIDYLIRFITSSRYARYHAILDPHQRATPACFLRSDSMQLFNLFSTTFLTVHANNGQH
ncbi:hypothetical protein BDV29DRAFT_141618 [Aspergillus leporis]|uniref:Transposase IS30-like HTH domain-containing protein n=1 Tax=Aspergillus leporis TaxID=41062 RepID=A0A5N5WXR0_9EURO|nr:hypothetical protein BDV29DRAFT_141618 [Aspergillus leporis]